MLRLRGALAPQRARAGALRRPLARALATQPAPTPTDATAEFIGPLMPGAAPPPTVPVPTLTPEPTAAAADAATGPAIPLQSMVPGGTPAPVLVEAGPETVESVTAAARDGGWILHYPMTGMQWTLTTLHDLTGLPWWATIAGFVVGVRVILFPATIVQLRSSAQLQIIKPRLDSLNAKVKAAMAEKTPKGMDDAMRHRTEVMALISKHKVRPFVSFALALGQAPLWMTVFFTLRMMAYRDSLGMPDLGMSTGGLLWFTDLTTRDSTYVLPAVCGVSFYAMACAMETTHPRGEGAMGAAMPYVMRGMALIMVPATYWMENALFVYWVTSNSLMFAQTGVLLSPAARAALALPPLPANRPKMSILPPGANVSGMLPEPLRMALGVKKEEAVAGRYRTAAAIAADEPPPQTFAHSPTAHAAPRAQPKQQQKRSQRGRRAKRRFHC